MHFKYSEFVFLSKLELALEFEFVFSRIGVCFFKDSTLSFENAALLSRILVCFFENSSLFLRNSNLCFCELDFALFPKLEFVYLRTRVCFFFENS